MEARLCVAGCRHVEDLNHLFLSCPTFGALWPLVRAWLGIEGGGLSSYLRPFLAIYSLFRWFEIAMIFFSPGMAPMCLGIVE